MGFNSGFKGLTENWGGGHIITVHEVIYPVNRVNVFVSAADMQ